MKQRDATAQRHADSQHLRRRYLGCRTPRQRPSVRARPAGRGGRAATDHAPPAGEAGAGVPVVRLQELMRLAPELQRRSLVRQPQLATLAAWRYVLEQARGSRSGPRHRRSAATLALLLADSLDERAYGAALVDDCRAQAGAALSRALLECGRGPEAAEAALVVAEAMALGGSGDPYVLADLLEARACLLQAGDDLPGAAQHLEMAARLCAEVGDPRRISRVEVRRSSGPGRRTPSLHPPRRGGRRPPPREKNDGLPRQPG